MIFDPDLIKIFNSYFIINDSISIDFFHSGSPTRLQSNLAEENMKDFDKSKGYQDTIIMPDFLRETLAYNLKGDIHFRNNIIALADKQQINIGNILATFYRSDYITGSSQISFKVGNKIYLYSGLLSFDSDICIPECDILLLDSRTFSQSCRYSNENEYKKIIQTLKKYVSDGVYVEGTKPALFKLLRLLDEYLTNIDIITNVAIKKEIDLIYSKITDNDVLSIETNYEHIKNNIKGNYICLLNTNKYHWLFESSKKIIISHKETDVNIDYHISIIMDYNHILKYIRNTRCEYLITSQGLPIILKQSINNLGVKVLDIQRIHNNSW